GVQSGVDGVADFGTVESYRHHPILFGYVQVLVGFVVHLFSGASGGRGPGLTGTVPPGTSMCPPEPLFMASCRRSLSHKGSGVSDRHTNTDSVAAWPRKRA